MRESGDRRTRFTKSTLIHAFVISQSAPKGRLQIHKGIRAIVRVTKNTSND